MCSINSINTLYAFLRIERIFTEEGILQDFKFSNSSLFKEILFMKRFVIELFKYRSNQINGWKVIDFSFCFLFSFCFFFYSL